MSRDVGVILLSGIERTRSSLMKYLASTAGNYCGIYAAVFFARLAGLNARANVIVEQTYVGTRRTALARAT
jgi:hypothetical protein